MIKLFNLKFKADKASSDDEIRAFVCANHPFIKILFNDYSGSLEVVSTDRFIEKCFAFVTTNIFKNPKTHKEFQQIIDNNIDKIVLQLKFDLASFYVKDNFYHDIKNNLEAYSILE